MGCTLGRPAVEQLQKTTLRGASASLRAKTVKLTAKGDLERAMLQQELQNHKVSTIIQTSTSN